MSIIHRMLKQKAVYWPPGSEDSGGQAVDDYGLPVYGNLMEIDCRWDDEVAEMLDSNGGIFMSRAKVYVDRDVSIGGVLMLGTTEGVIDESVPKNNLGAYEIRAFLKNPNFKATDFLRTAVL